MGRVGSSIGSGLALQQGVTSSLVAFRLCASAYSRRENKLSASRCFAWLALLIVKRLRYNNLTTASVRSVQSTSPRCLIDTTSVCMHIHASSSWSGGKCGFRASPPAWRILRLAVVHFKGRRSDPPYFFCANERHASTFVGRPKLRSSSQPSLIAKF